MNAQVLSYWMAVPTFSTAWTQINFPNTGQTSSGETWVSRNRIIEASADTVWQLLRRLDGVENYAGEFISNSKLEGEPGEGCLRLCTMTDGSLSKETITHFDDTQRTYSFTIESDGFRVKSMAETVHVLDLGYRKSMLMWTNRFEAVDGQDHQELAAMIGGLIDIVTDNVAKLATKSAS